MLLGGGIAMAVIGGRGRRPPPPEGEPAGGAPRPPRCPARGRGAATRPAERYPVDLTGELDPGLSRWLWLVKWLLLIPHYIVLLFLWIAYFAVTVIAFFAILFTARYPRPLFDFTTGVLRWSWRVGFYGYSALGTDRYPPFSLERTDHPGEIDVPYPERLSRGLVLIKWWLLAIPQYIVIAILAGNWSFGWGGGWGDDWGWWSAWSSFAWGPTRRRADRHPGPLRRHRRALHRALPARAVRADRRPEPLGLPGGRVRLPHAGRVPPVQRGALGATGADPSRCLSFGALSFEASELESGPGGSGHGAAAPAECVRGLLRAR